MKKLIKPLFAFTLLALFGGLALIDFKNFRSHENRLQSAADNGALSITMRIQDEEELVDGFKVSLTEISKQMRLEEFLYAEWTEDNKSVKVTASLPFKGFIFRKKTFSKHATVKVTSFSDND